MKIKPAKKLGKLMQEVDERTEPKIAAALFNKMRKLPAVRLKKILTTTDFSRASIDGVRLARWLGHRFSASVLLTHVVEPPPYFSGIEDVVLARADREMVKLAGRQLKRLVRRELGGKGKVEACIRRGKAFHEIAALAKERGVDLIVIATRGHTGLKRAWLGSTAERVVRHSPCSVLTVPTQKPAARGKGFVGNHLKRIIVPIDCSITSVQALPYATALADKFGAEILLLHVIEPMDLPREYDVMPAEATEWDEEDLVEACLTQLRQKVLDTSYRVRIAVRHGQPFRQITTVAKDFGADLILLTTHGYTGLKHVVLGSTAERVVRHADCPVLIVRDRIGVRHTRRSK